MLDYSKHIGSKDIRTGELYKKIAYHIPLSPQEKEVMIPYGKEEFKANTVAIALLKAYNFPITSKLKAYYGNSVRDIQEISKLAGTDFLEEINNEKTIYHQDTVAIYSIMRELTKECEKLNLKSKSRDGMEL
jgi:hypothetical protein